MHLRRSNHGAAYPHQQSNEYRGVHLPSAVAPCRVVYAFNIGPMQAVRLLPTIKQNKDAAGPRLMELDAQHRTNFRRFTRVANFAYSTKSNSVANPERMRQCVPLFW